MISIVSAAPSFDGEICYEEIEKELSTNMPNSPLANSCVLRLKEESCQLFFDSAVSEAFSKYAGKGTLYLCTKYTRKLTMQVSCSGYQRKEKDFPSHIQK